MPFTRSGKHYSFQTRRICKKCHETTEQTCINAKYRAPEEPTVPASYLKEHTWICTLCDNTEVETKTVYEPSDKALIFKRLLRIQDDYDILETSISSVPDGIVFRVRLPGFDIGEVRAIQAKAEETGFIRVDELMKLQKAGYRRPPDVPPKPQPKDRRTLRERARQRMFVGEPRSL